MSQELGFVGGLVEGQCLSALKILEVVELWNLSTSALINASTQSPVPKIKVHLQALLDPMTLVWTPVSASVYNQVG